jgi:trigger factor
VSKRQKPKRQKEEQVMEIKEAKVSGLNHIYKVFIPAEQIEQKVKDKLEATGRKAKIPGFRPGKAPLQVIQQRYESSIRPDVLHDLLNDTVRKVIDDKKLRPAVKPELKVDKYEEGQSLECTIEIEVLPEIKEVDLKKIDCEKFVTAVDDKQVMEQLENLAKGNKETKKLDKPRAAKNGDTVDIDFNGRTLAGPINGGSGKGVHLELGSGSFIPGFEEQLIGMNAGDERTITVTFPKDYQAEELAGQEANFVVKVREVLETVAPKIDEEFAKRLNFKALDDLKNVIKNSIERENERMTFLLMKKQILDQLDKLKVELPQSLVEAEFKIIWQNHMEEEGHEHEHEHDCDDDSCGHEDHKKDKKAKKGAKKDEHEKDRKLYHDLAERRVRLGLLLAEIGVKHKVEVTRDELQSAIFNHARRFPGQEKKVLDYYQQNPQALQQLRAPIFEDKVIDVIAKNATVKEKKVSQKNLEDAVKEITEGDIE